MTKSIKVSPTVTQRLHAMQALRAYAAAMVVFVHAISTYISKVDSSVLVVLPYGLGELGVKLFFCISGFIIYNSTKNMNQSFASTTLFLQRRFIRVVPLYWLATTVYAIKLSLQGMPPSAQNFLYSLFFIPYISENDLMRPVLGVGWSLNYEMFFYSLFGLALFLQARWRILFLSLTLLFLVGLRNYDLITLDGGFIERCLYLLSDNYLFYFIAGILVAGLKERFASIGLNIGLSFRLSLSLSTALLVFYMLANVYLHPQPVLIEIMMAVVCSTSLTVCAFERKFIGNVGRFASIVELAGNASYSTYLVHGFVMGPVARLIAIGNLELSPLIFAFVMVFVCTFVGIVVYRFVEQPLLNKLRGKFA